MKLGFVFLAIIGLIVGSLLGFQIKAPLYQPVSQQISLKTSDGGSSLTWSYLVRSYCVGDCTDYADDDSGGSSWGGGGGGGK